MSLTGPRNPRQGRIALVTGANKGIGKDIAKMLVADDTIQTTLVACRTNGKETAEELGADGPNDACRNVYLDLTDDTSIQQCREFVESRYGRLNVLINNAAICFNDRLCMERWSIHPLNVKHPLQSKQIILGPRNSQKP